MANVILPLNMEFVPWAIQIRQSLPNIDIPIPSSVEKWREWASFVKLNSQFANVPAPTEIAYPKTEDWKIWGAYFISSIYNL